MILGVFCCCIFVCFVFFQLFCCRLAAVLGVIVSLHEPVSAKFQLSHRCSGPVAVKQAFIPLPCAEQLVWFGLICCVCLFFPNVLLCSVTRHLYFSLLKNVAKMFNMSYGNTKDSSPFECKYRDRVVHGLSYFREVTAVNLFCREVLVLTCIYDRVHLVPIPHTLTIKGGRQKKKKLKE